MTEPGDRALAGIWDVLSSQQVIDVVRRSIADGKPLPTIAEDLMDRCLAPDSDWGGVGCDNMTAMIIAIKGDRSTQQWYDWVKQRVDAGQPYDTPKEFVDPFSQGGSAAGGGPMGGPRGALTGATRVLGSQPDDDHDEDDDEGEELDLPTIQAALKARMAELERESGLTATTGSGAGSGAEVEEIEMADGANREADDKPTPPTTSLSPPKTL